MKINKYFIIGFLIPAIGFLLSMVGDSVLQKLIDLQCLDRSYANKNCGFNLVFVIGLPIYFLKLPAVYASGFMGFDDYPVLRYAIGSIIAGLILGLILYFLEKIINFVREK